MWGCKVRRRAVLAALVAALAPRALHAGSNVSATCPPPFVRTDDPLRLAFETDLHQWANTNRHVRRATVMLHPTIFAHLFPTKEPPVAAMFEFNTRFTVMGGLPLRVPWIIVAECVP